LDRVAERSEAKRSFCVFVCSNRKIEQIDEAGSPKYRKPLLAAKLDGTTIQNKDRS